MSSETPLGERAGEDAEVTDLIDPATFERTLSLTDLARRISVHEIITFPWFRPIDCLQGPDGCVYVVDFYDRGGGRGAGVAVPNQDPDVVPLRLTAAEKAALVRFAAVQRIRRGMVEQPQRKRVEPRALERPLDRAPQVLAFETFSCRIGGAIDAALRHERELRVLLRELAEQTLHASAAVSVCGVEEVETHVDRTTQHLLCICLFDGAVAVTAA